jgi:hypothetical protein
MDGEGMKDKNNMTYAYLMKAADDNFDGDYIDHQIKYINVFFGGVDGIRFVFPRVVPSIVELINACGDGDSVMIVEPVRLLKDCYSMSKIGDLCIQRGVSFEILVLGFKHCDTEESRKILDSIDNNKAINVDITL